MNLEKYFKSNDIEFTDKQMSTNDAKIILRRIKKLEEGDCLLPLVKKDRGLTKKDFDEIFLPLVEFIDYDSKKATFIRSWLCMMGPIAYEKVTKAIHKKAYPTMTKLEEFL